MFAIEVDHLSKYFDVYRRPSDRFKEVLLFERKKFHQRFWALRDISFSIQGGSTVGIIGQNGSGKSTLLKILAGLMLPSSGDVRVNGKRSSIIELGMGFHPEFSGRSNVYLNSALLGISKEEIDAKFDQIVEFSGIGDFIDRPVKTYSSGMYLRLAFSIVISVNPEILLIDEVLAVGDALFSQKCIKKLREFQERGATILFVSHDMSAIRNLSNEALLLDQGLLIERGDPEEILSDYTALIQKRYAEEAKQITFVERVEKEKKGRKQRYGNFDAMIADIRLLNPAGEEIGAVVSGEEYIIMVKAIFFEDVNDAVVGILIRDRLGNDIFGTNTGFYDQHTGPIKKGEMVSVKFSLKMNIGPGDYSITAAIHPDKFGFEGHFDWMDKAISFKVLSSEPRFIGVSKLTPQIAIYRSKGGDLPEMDNPLNAVFPDAPDLIGMKESFQKYLVKGWHGAENWGGDHGRWTRKEPVFIMRISGSRIKMEVETLKPNIKDEPITGDFFCNGTRIGNFIINDCERKRIDFHLEDRLKGQVGRCKIVMNGIWCPDDFYRNGDKRELAIFVRKIWCED